MKPRSKRALPWILVTTALLAAIVLLMLPAIQHNERTRKQQALAQQLGVGAAEYPYPASFPAGYFDTVLTPGMALQEVHRVVQGYDHVYHCDGDIKYELYYFFGSDNHEAILLLIDYDRQQKFEDLRSSDWDSPTLGGQACAEGLLGSD